MNEIRPSVYRTAVKLQTLQRLCHMDVVFVRHVAAAAAPRSVGGAMTREEVTRALDRMFHSVSQEVPGQVATPEEATSLMLTIVDRGRSGRVAIRSLHTALIALCADTLQAKFTGLLDVLDDKSGSVSRSGLRSLLQDLSQIPAAVQEEGAFGGVEAAVKSCFDGALTPAVSRRHVLSWLQTEPRLLLWLPTLYRLSVSRDVTHNVRCHTCRTSPITGLRFRCLKCLNIHVCQSCFLSLRQTRKHKRGHPVLELCTQPTWRESLSSLLHNTRRALLPRRYTQRDSVRKRVVVWAEPEDAGNSAPPPLDGPTGLADSVPGPSPEEDGSGDGSAPPSPPRTDDSSEQVIPEDLAVHVSRCDHENLTPCFLSKAAAAAALLSDVRNLQRDKRLWEAELQEWRAAVESEQGDLEYRCSEMEVTMETLRQHNAHLQDMLTQALNNRREVNNLERGQNDGRETGDVSDEDSEGVDDVDREEAGETETGHVNKTDRKQEDDADGGHVSDADTEHERLPDGGQITPPSDVQTNDEEEEELMKTMGSWSDEEPETPSPTMHQHLAASHDYYLEESEDVSLHQQMRSQHGPEEAGLTEDTCPSDGEDGGSGTRRPEDLLQETVDRLKTAMETGRWTPTGVTKRAELVDAAEQVGDSILHLVDGVK
ncbi:dystrotelin-like [Salarias fasciatus]|uniref:dystrotelin-like n=1 Tax=Salarias fasciatus TaxID=181472 RepID=UPI001176649A|nr:dystrotelin-like [Salarias fasciatus]